MEPILLLSLIIIGLLAGVLGALFGIGGGIIIIPMLTIFYGMSAADAAAVSLIGIVATSVGGTLYYMENKVTNIRLGLLLEISTIIGSMIGVFLALALESWIIMLVFSAVLTLTAIKMLLNPSMDVTGTEDGEFSYNDLRTGETIRYDIEHKGIGFSSCVLAGIISSLTGVGGGLIKVPIMNMVMKVPMKAATATSSYMIGITAFSGSILYFLSGHVDLEMAAFVAIGTFLGAVIGSRLSRRFDSSSMKKYFSILVLAIAFVMVLQAGGIL